MNAGGPARQILFRDEKARAHNQRLGGKPFIQWRQFAAIDHRLQRIRLGFHGSRRGFFRGCGFFNRRLSRHTTGSNCEGNNQQQNEQTADHANPHHCAYSAMCTKR